MTDEAVVALEQVSVSYPVTAGAFGRVVGRTPVLDAVDIALCKGEVLGLLGESGSGKSTLGRVMLGLLSPETGTVRYRGKPIVEMSEGECTVFRRNAQLIFQDSLSALNPTMTIEQLVTEPLRIRGDLKRASVREKAIELLASVSLEAELASRRPAELSGGQRQRVVIARALSVQPDLVVADEPASALDVSVQAQILELLTELRRSMQLTMLFISHDIAVVRYVADRIAVMYRGAIVEIADAADLISSPRHPYTRALLASSPDFEGRHFEARSEVKVKKTAAERLDGCVFQDRCGHATNECRTAVPRLRRVAPGHSHACIRES